MDIRDRDIFRFSYSAECRAKMFEPYHCFDGQLLAVKRGDGITLLDTFWLYNFDPRGDSGKVFTEQSAREAGELTFVCNLDDVDKIEKYQADYYDDADVFNLSHQHGCYPYYALRKGATRSRSKMLRVIDERIEAENRKIQSATYSIAQLSRSIEKIEQGRIDEVYL